MNTYTKNILFSGLVCLILIQLACSSDSASNKGFIPVHEKATLNLKCDSGYVLSNEALRFLINKALIDTISPENKNDYIQYCYKSEDSTSDNSTEYYYTWYSAPNDTIGKYYKVETGNFIVALSLSREILLLEIDSDSNLVNSELFGHGNYACCWNDFDDMLKRYNNYLGVMTCGTGTAYCSSYITFFKNNIVPQNGVPAYESSIGFGEVRPGHLLTSDIQFKDSCLIMHYTLEKFTIDEQGEKQTISTEPFTVNYHFKVDSGFQTNERSKFDDMLF